MRIILVDDHPLVREGLREMLRAMAGVEVIAEAGDGRTAVRLVAELSPDVVVMDIDMPDLNGYEATRLISQNVKGPKVIALSASDSAQCTRRMLKAGASAYVVKAAAFKDFGDALRAVQAGKIYLSPELTDSVVSQEVHSEHTPTAFSSLTGREREILQLVAEGHDSKGIAAKLQISVKTIETHRKHLMEKLALHSVAELTKYAIREGITRM